MKPVDLIGRVFGRLRVVDKAQKIPNDTHTMWGCRCYCGNKRIVRSSCLISGETQSCGCLQKERTAKANFKHGLSHTNTHRCWGNMRSRCSDSGCKPFKNYGGRGISVCNRWDSFENFLEDMGKMPKGMTLERIDNNGDYEPSNCKWATYKEQAHNRRNTRLTTHAGVTLTFKDWSIKLGGKEGLVSGRVRRGWSIIKAITTPPS